MMDIFILIAVSFAFWLSGMEPPDTVMFGFLAVIYYRVRLLEVKD